MNPVLASLTLVLSLALPRFVSADGTSTTEQPASAVAVADRTITVQVDRTDSTDVFEGMVTVHFRDAAGNVRSRYTFARRGMAEIQVPSQLSSSRIYIEVGYISDLWCFPTSIGNGPASFRATYGGINPNWGDHDNADHRF